MLDYLDFEDQELICVDDIKDIKFELGLLKKEKEFYHYFIDNLPCVGLGNIERYKSFHLSHSSTLTREIRIRINSHSGYLNYYGFNKYIDEIISTINKNKGSLYKILKNRIELEEKIKQKEKQLENYEKKRDVGLFYYRYVPDKIYDYTTINNLIEEIENEEEFAKKPYSINIGKEGMEVKYKDGRVDIVRERFITTTSSESGYQIGTAIKIE